MNHGCAGGRARPAPPTSRHTRARPRAARCSRRHRARRRRRVPRHPHRHDADAPRGDGEDDQADERGRAGTSRGTRPGRRCLNALRERDHRPPVGRLGDRQLDRADRDGAAPPDDAQRDERTALPLARGLRPPRPRPRRRRARGPATPRRPSGYELGSSLGVRHLRRLRDHDDALPRERCAAR